MNGPEVTRLDVVEDGETLAVRVGHGQLWAVVGPPLRAIRVDEPGRDALGSLTYRDRAVLAALLDSALHHLERQVGAS